MKINTGKKIKKNLYTIQFHKAFQELHKIKIEKNIININKNIFLVRKYRFQLNTKKY